MTSEISNLESPADQYYGLVARVSREAFRLWRFLDVGARADGPDHAVPQREIARRTGLPVRTIQEDLALELLAAGVPLATTCGNPSGMFLARSAADLEPYLRQLESRCKGLYKRRRLVRQIWRQMQANESTDRDPPRDETGQLVLPLAADEPQVSALRPSVPEPLRPCQS